MRVLHVDASAGYRGGQVQVRLLVRHGPRPVAVVVRKDGRLREVLEGDGAPLAAVGFRGRWSGGADLAALVRSLRPELVAAHDGHGAALALAHVRDTPVVVHRRVDFIPSRAGYARYRRAAGVIAVSEAVAAVLRRGGVERVAVVEDGVDPGPLVGAAPDPALAASLGLPMGFALAVGALVPHKGHEWLLRALPLVPDLGLVVLGEGPLREPLRRLAGSLGVGERVRWLGHRDDVPRFLATARVFVHPSVEEGLGQAVLEAAFAGAPIVTTTAGGLAGLGFGHSVPPKDPVALASALKRSLAEPARADPAELARRFTIDTVVRRTVTTWADLVR